MTKPINTNRWVSMLAVALITLAAFSQASMAADVQQEAQSNATNIEGIRAANEQFYGALNAVFAGDMSGMNAIWSHSDDTSYRGPFDDNLNGWTAIGKQFEEVTAMKIGGSITCEDLIVRAGKDLGYTVCVEQGENEAEDGKPVKVSQRATNVFRLEDGQWKLVHHHTDISVQLEQAFSVPAK